MATIQNLMEKSLLEVFGQRDAEKRLATMRDVYTDDIAFSDAEGTVTGLDAVNQKVTALLAGAPGFVFVKASPVHEVRDLGALSWHFGPEGGQPVVHGTDVALTKDGKIHAIYTYLTEI